MKRLSRVQWALFGLFGLVLLAVGWTAYSMLRLPNERTVEGAYLRMAQAIAVGVPERAFPFLEGDAKHALCTIHDYRRQSRALVLDAFPEPERSEWLRVNGDEGAVESPEALWVLLAGRHRWDEKLRADLSGIQGVERLGPRATVITVQGTRYPFRLADDGIWGLTWFTPELVQHKSRAVHDLEILKNAANDYRQRRRP